eukprot:scaffold82602_cov34-Phaeocystis_antarctica.AAC.2
MGGRVAVVARHEVPQVEVEIGLLTTAMLTMAILTTPAAAAGRGRGLSTHYGYAYYGNTYYACCSRRSRSRSRLGSSETSSAVRPGVRGRVGARVRVRDRVGVRDRDRVGVGG